MNCWWISETHKEFKEQVFVWILVLKADGALFLQMDSIDERDHAFIPVGLQIVALRHPGGTAGHTYKVHFNRSWFFLTWFSFSCVSYTLTCCRWVCHLPADRCPGRLPSYWILQAWNPIGQSEYRCLESSFLLHTGCTPEPSAPGTPRPHRRTLGDRERGGVEGRKKKQGATATTAKPPSCFLW